jgi:hypothetical protein
MPNYVTVAINAVNEDLSNLDNGHIAFTPSDIVWVQSGNLVAPLHQINLHASGGVSTDATAQLFAMDNAGVSTNWKWVMSGELQGFAFPPRYLTVLFSNGANQNLADLLQASVLVPGGVPTP